MAYSDKICVKNFIQNGRVFKCLNRDTNRARWLLFSFGYVSTKSLYPFHILGYPVALNNALNFTLLKSLNKSEEGTTYT